MQSTKPLMTKKKMAAKVCRERSVRSDSRCSGVGTEYHRAVRGATVPVQCRAIGWFPTISTQRQIEGTGRPATRTDSSEPVHAILCHITFFSRASPHNLRIEGTDLVKN